MKKSLLVASLCCALAAAANAQPSPAQNPSGQSADTRAADLNRTMEIRNWQAGPSAGDAASKIDPNAAAMSPEEKRAADLQTMMEIRSWQTGPSSGDAAAKAATQASSPSAAVDLNNAGAQQELHDASTP